MKKQVLFFVLMLMPLMVSASTEINGIYYDFDPTNKVAEVTYVPSGTTKYSGSITIPNTIAYEGVTYSVTSIGDHAFYGCSGLTSITIPNSVTSIDSFAFSDCSGLTSIIVENGNIVYDSRNNCNAIIKTSTNVLIAGCKSTIIPNSVTSIGDDAFYGCSGLTSVTIPNSVTSIGSMAFYFCSGLTFVTIPNSVKWIGYYAFYGCSGLNTINILDIAAWCKIGMYDENSNPWYNDFNNAHHLFLNGTEVRDLIIPRGITSINIGAFCGCSSLTSVTIGNDVTSIEKYAFLGCSSLTSVIIPQTVTSIGEDAFFGCTSLPVVNNCRYADTYLVEVLDKTIASFAIREGTRFINNSAFSGCSWLTSITIPNSVTSIGDYTFQGCSELSSVSIGKGIKSVGTKAFANCPEIKEVYCYAKEVPTISNDTFENSYYVKFATLYVPEASVDLYKASLWSQFGNIVGITGGNEEERCAKPVITLLANGKVKVECATEGATCVTNITASNAEPLIDGEISLNTPLIVLTVTSYATKEGYNDSEVATATFRYEKAEGDMNGDGMLNITDVIHLVNMILGQ